MATSAPKLKPNHCGSNDSSFSHLSASTASESFHLSTSSSDSDSAADASIQPTGVTSGEPSFRTRTNHPLKLDNTIYSFVWSNSNFGSTENPLPWNAPNSSTDNCVMSVAGLKDRKGEKQDVRSVAPTLPPPTFWSALTHPDWFGEYIDTKGLLPHNPNVTSIGNQVPHQEPFEKPYANKTTITLANTSKAKIVGNCSTSWVDQHLFADNKLPVPFNPSLLSSDPKLWNSPSMTDPSIPSTFASLPNLLDSVETKKWLNHLGNSLGVLHGLVPKDKSSMPSNPTPQPKDVPHGDRSFDCEGSDKQLRGGLLKRKPDIVVIDRAYQHSVAAEVRLRWPLVQALVEISVQDSKSRSYDAHMQTILEKAANVFDAQLHRRFIPFLILYGKGSEMRFIFGIVDRIGAITTKAAIFEDFSAMTLARIIFAFTFGSDWLLGADPKVEIDCFTGNPLSVVVDEQRFTIVTEISVSPILFGRGTRVYIVKDTNGRYHILKDSWVLATHDNSEIDLIQQISRCAQSEGMDSHFRNLCPRFVAGDNHVDDTSVVRGLLASTSPGRIRRRIVTGPIGDPITSYRSRVECLQALIDAVDQLTFLDSKCGLVHGDISINNVLIVRFLPNILNASSTSSDSTAAHLSSPTAGQQSMNSTSSALSSKPSASFSAPSGAMNLKTCSKNGYLFELKSGGSVIDFDYTRANNSASTTPSGTMPYMSIDLMSPELQIPKHHRLRHDIESLCLVFIHLLRFTSGPVGTSIGDIKLDARVAVWHHEHNLKFLLDHKRIDLHEIYKKPNTYISSYWAPIAAQVSKLLVAIYPGIDKFEMSSKGLNVEEVRSVLVEARDHCVTVSETIPNYGAFEDEAQAQAAARKSSRSKNSRQKHTIQLEEEPYRRVRRRNSQVMPFSRYQDSTTIPESVTGTASNSGIMGETSDSVMGEALDSVMGEALDSVMGEALDSAMVAGTLDNEKYMPLFNPGTYVP